MKMMTEAKLRELLERAYARGGDDVSSLMLLKQMGHTTDNVIAKALEHTVAAQKLFDELIAGV